MGTHDQDPRLLDDADETGETVADEPLAVAVRDALAADVNDAVAEGPAPWDDFADGVWARIDETPEPHTASAREPLAVAVRDALAADVNDAVAEGPAPWDDFADGVWARIDETPEAATGSAWTAITEALREDNASALADFEARVAEFEDGFALRRAEDLDANAVTIGDMLREEVDAAVAEKDGVWSAFAHQVMMAIDHAESERVGVDVSALAALRADVDAELDAMAPRFDRDFKEEVERRIFRAGRESEPWWSRVGETVRGWLQPSPGLGLAVAAAAAVAFVVVRTPAPPAVPVVDDGRVSISAVRFEGDVTVMPDEGIAVVWVTDNAS